MSCAQNLSNGTLLDRVEVSDVRCFQKRTGFLNVSLFTVVSQAAVAPTVSLQEFDLAALVLQITRPQRAASGVGALQMTTLLVTDCTPAGLLASPPTPRQ